MHILHIAPYAPNIKATHQEWLSLLHLKSHQQNVNIMSPEEKRWEQSKNIMILALHSMMCKSEFKIEYSKELAHFRSMTRQHDADILLQDLFGQDDPDSD